MKRAIRKAGTAAAVTAGAVALMAGPAFANDCFNSSRNPAPTPNAIEVEPGISVQGHWANFDGEGWGFAAPGSFGFNGNFTNGKTDALVANAADASDGRVCGAAAKDITGGFESLHGVQSPEACGW